MPSRTRIVFLILSLFFLGACAAQPAPEGATPRATSAVARPPTATVTAEESPTDAPFPAGSPALSPTALPDDGNTAVLTETLPSEPAEAAPQAGMSTALPGFRPPEAEEPGWLFHGTGDRLPPITFSPDGTMLATGHNDGSVRLWDLASGGQIRELTAVAGGELTAVAFSPDGLFVAAAGPGAGTIDLWRAATGEWVQTLEGGAGLSDVAFSGDGRLLAGGIARGDTRAALGQVFVWDTERWAIQQVLADVAPDVVFGREGATLATVSGVPLAAMGATIEAGAVVLWDAGRGEQVQQLGVDGYVVGIDYHSGEDTVAANILQSTQAEPGYASLTVLLDANSGEIVHSLPAPAEGGALPLFVEEVALSPDASRVAVGYRPDQIGIWEVARGELLRTVSTPAEWLRYPAFSPDGTLLAASSADGRILLWQVNGASGD